MTRRRATVVLLVIPCSCWPGQEQPPGGDDAFEVLPSFSPVHSFQYNLGVQHQLASQLVVEVMYIGNLSRHLPSSNRSINQTPPDRVTPVQVQASRPFPQFTNVTAIFPTIGTSNYHAGVVSVVKRFSEGFQLSANYTYANWLSDTDSAGGEEGNVGTYVDFYNRARDYGPAGNDIRHAAKANAVYELPFGPGKSRLTSGWLGHIIGNWTFGTQVVWQSGAPLTVTTQTGTNGNHFPASQRADQIGNPELPASERNADHWFNIAAFAQPAVGSFGSSERGVIRAPGLFTMDISATKNIPLGAERQLQFRVDAFNATNHINFGV